LTVTPSASASACSCRRLTFWRPASTLATDGRLMPDRSAAVGAQLPDARADPLLQGFGQPVHRPTRSSIPTL
jgi:hypothetical protein